MTFREHKELNQPGDKPMDTKQPRILIAEDDDEMRSLLMWALLREGYEVIGCSDGIHLFDYLSPLLDAPSNSSKMKPVDLIISDIRMPGVTGLEILEGMNECGEFPPMILITAFGDEETHVFAKRFGATAVFNKPFAIDDLLDKISDILKLNIRQKTYV